MTAAAGAAAAWGLSDFLAGLLARRLPVLTILIGSRIAAMLLALLVVAVRGIPPVWDNRLWLAVAAGLVGLPSMGLLYRAMRDGSPAVVAPVAAVAAVVPVGWGLLHGERLGVGAALGVTMGLVGATMASWPVPSGDRHVPGGDRHLPSGERQVPNGERHVPSGERQVPSGERHVPSGERHLPSGEKRLPDGERRRMQRSANLCALGAALGFGVYFVLLPEAGATDPVWALAIARITEGIGALILALALGRCDRTLLRAPIIAVGATDAAADAAFLAAAAAALTPAAVVASLYPAVTLLLNRSLLRERLHTVHLYGVVAAVFAVACLAR
ncbi:EamA family transporter [Actinoplanes sp. CA-142083]|uniref:EamA family transporter n=1 Tax=Actinoplanes sp. CA-142083 TaxID=3239903 RepID=UPI003D9195FB